MSRLRAEHAHDRVLIVSHSVYVPWLLEAFGHSAWLRIERFEYDNLFVIVPQANGAPRVLRLRYGE